MKKIVTLFLSVRVPHGAQILNVHVRRQNV